MKLGIDEDELAGCVSCGLCLPHCPTWRVSGEEALSPRGRIAAMRQVQLDGAPADADFVHSMDTCVQCRGCETACPSAVPFGHLMEATRETLVVREIAAPPWWQRLGYRALGSHRIVVAGSRLAAVAQRLHLVPRRLALAPLPLRQPRLEASGDDVWLFVGCVMDAWQRDIHQATKTVLESLGLGVALARTDAGCCGALSMHAGLGDQGRAYAHRTIRAYPGSAPILVNSAGCGAQMKEYGRLLDSTEARAFSARVHDVHEWLAARVGDLVVRRRPALVVAVQDPCHLRHAQRVEGAVRTVLGTVAELVEVDDDGLCCGAGGAYSLLQPRLSAEIGDRKVAALRRTGAAVVASANPGCILQLRARGVDVRHPMQLVCESLGR